MRRRIFRIFAWLSPSSKVRTFFHRLSGSYIGKDGFIGANVMIDSEYSYLVEIEADVYIAPGVQVLAHATGSKYHGKYHKVEKTKLYTGCWIGAGAIILPGVHIGRGAIVSAGSVVFRNVPPFTVVAGNPARTVGVVDRD